MNTEMESMGDVGAALPPESTGMILLKGHTESITAVCFPEAGGVAKVCSPSLFLLGDFLHLSEDPEDQD